jgi:hypothetical protein
MSLAMSLPAIDRTRLAEKNDKHLEAMFGTYARGTRSADAAVDHATLLAGKEHAQFESWRKMGLRRQDQLASARAVLTAGPRETHAAALQEALRETARESARSEEMLKRRLAAAAAFDLASRRAEAAARAHDEELRRALTPQPLPRIPASVTLAHWI